MASKRVRPKVSSTPRSGPSTHSDVQESDSDAALVLVGGEKAKNLGIQVLPRIRGYVDAAQVIATPEVAEVEDLDATIRGEVHRRLNSEPW